MACTPDAPCFIGTVDEDPDELGYFWADDQPTYVCDWHRTAVQRRDEN